MPPEETLKQVAAELPVFQANEQKQLFLFVIGALAARLISLRKAAELMALETDTLIELLDTIGLDFSYLSEADISIEKA
ncbi:hypothetical protein IQ241_10410 [Romeria aff. gracilis LEGE 07310]|uniref:Uncharacterized protein n=1 Tax=Vasconcelosia minhoensis LEGE 07310 TaxID=915328 RepID=A0A8J7AVG7_9CYAN|nr:hypothetical protein [Romeria gracilis]MBE9077703.1 hypothetical protein [Romeria aff. gracilis LEGE 07310]